MVLAAHHDTAGRRTARSWPGDTIRYYETIPDKWQWSLDNAIDHWNGTGANIRFVKVSSAPKAQLLIRYGPTYGADGIGTLGYAGPARKNIVHLSTAYKKVNENRPEERAWVARLFAHELGHNLGYDHVLKPRCALMQAVFVFGVCGPLADVGGYYLCRYIDADLLKRHVGRYGGSAEQPPKACLLAALPPALQDVRSSGGGVETDSVVTLSWDGAGQPEGGRVLVMAWPEEDCASPPKGLRSRDIPTDKGFWVDDRPSTGRWCYRLTPTNRFLGEGPSVTFTVDRSRPAPATPVLGPISLARGDYSSYWTFTVELPKGITLLVLRDPEDPAACAEPSDERLGEQVHLDDQGRGEVYAVAARECLVFVAETEGRTSPPVSHQVEAPPTPAPTLHTVTRVDGGYAYEVTASAAGRVMTGAILPGPCPSGPVDFVGSTFYEDETAYLYPEASGENCLVVAALDEWGDPGPTITRPLTVTFDE